MTRRCPWKKSRPAPPPPPPPQQRPSTLFVRGEHEFHIVGYSKAHQSVLSGAFHVGGHTWALDCRFDEEHGQLAYVSLELLTAYIAEDAVVAKAALRIEDPLGRWQDAEWRSGDDAHTFPVWSGGTWERFETDGRSWKLCVPDEFRGHESRYVHDDHLTIHCTLDVLQEEEDSTLADDIHKLLLPSPEPAPAGTESWSEKRRRAVMTPDVTFLVEQTEVQAHRLVLAMRSPVFAAELLGDMRESTSRIRVHDMRASTFRAMIRFIYTDKLPIKAKTDDSASRRSRRACKEKCAARRRVAMACDLLVAADRYDLEKLRLMCEKILSEGMGVDSVLPTLIVVHGRHNCRQLEASCVEYLASNADVLAAVKATEEYKELEESCCSFVAEVMNKVATHKSRVVSSSLGTTTNCRRPYTTSVSTYNSSEVLRGTLELRVPSFSSLLRSRGVDGEIKSDTLQIDGHDWRLLVYIREKYLSPNDTSKEVGIFFTTELLTDPGIAGVRASLCYRMGDPSGNSASTMDHCQNIFTRQHPAFGGFMSGKHVESHYLAHEGSLTIHCDIEVANKSPSATSATSGGVRDTTLVPALNIAWHLEQLLMSKMGSDLTFLVEQREIRAHKLVIATRSPVLYKWLRMSLIVANKGHILPVYQMKAAVFEAMLHFIYTNNLPPMEDISLAASGVEDVLMIAGDMLAAAYFFRLDGMKAKCMRDLANRIHHETERREHVQASVPIPLH